MTTNEEIVKTCENCKYEFEDMEGTHCRHCIHNAEEHFEPKETNGIVSFLEYHIKVETKRFNDAKEECNYNETCIHEYARQCYQMVLDKIKAGGSR